ncbi:hypothetical protein GUITHDRAFT_106168 [Guillardia theta CCMP2712]|uniref:Uncharacterized protein n=1 Tax=Guillardia theta (strain CCMP2712) TaxID=905079 RepID=L1JIV9_GUITC|nr:hypothetical protein GUITHDRAFT_106168 [Guillardia theta CCMP2712]EKX48089.1 hypothetical protein GUITHDRAFT_106168 [Guillardia theta CCMP2712]|eukprot:XP_005835069.1 hypothetical protein GUITHDRAFT_106168 [Guillardia theta CCMP2712]
MNAKSEQQKLSLSNIWVLAESNGPVRQEEMNICKAFMQICREDNNKDKLRAFFAENRGKPVLFEMKTERKDFRKFLFSGGETMSIQEGSFGDSGLGYSIWDAGLALSIWIQMNGDKFAGRDVLELGSGVGVTGICMAKSSANQVVLSDFGNVEDEGEDEGERNSVVERNLQPRNLLENLLTNVELNGLEEKCQVTRLDWHACLADSFRPVKEFQCVIGSDVIYYEEDAEALTAAIVKHLRAGGTFFLMNRRGRPGLSAVLENLERMGKVEVTELSLFNNFDSTPLLFATFTKG